MELAGLLDPAVLVSAPPPGAVNVRYGEAIEGPGGTWVPCVSRVCPGLYVSGIFQVGPGRRQVCTPQNPLPCADQALSHAIELASSAAA